MRIIIILLFIFLFSILSLPFYSIIVFIYTCARVAVFSQQNQRKRGCEEKGKSSDDLIVRVHPCSFIVHSLSHHIERMKIKLERIANGIAQSESAHCVYLASWINNVHDYYLL